MAKETLKLLGEIPMAEIGTTKIATVDRDYACFELGIMKALDIPRPDAFAVTRSGRINFCWDIGADDYALYRAGSRQFWCIFTGGQRILGHGLPELRARFLELDMSALAAEAAPA